MNKKENDKTGTKNFCNSIVQYIYTLHMASICVDENDESLT